MLELAEVAQHLQTNLARFLGMKLHSKQMIALDRC
jgi:hypothetical protein